MPIPNVEEGIARRCAARSKRSGLRCWNLCAYGLSVCRMHGARKPETVLRGSAHPAFRHGKATSEIREANRQTSLKLHNLLAAGKTVGLFSQEVALRGRKPKGHSVLVNEKGLLNSMGCK